MTQHDATKPATRTPSSQTPNQEPRAHQGTGGELHQTTEAQDRSLTTNQGVIVSDDQNSLKSGSRGPTLLEDFVLREKITHFDHERIPERIVHARGSGAHGYFEAYGGVSALTKAGFLQEKGKKTPVFVRFSTVAGGAGSVDTPRDVRGFAVKFYTEEGNFDLVGNNIPVFFIQDAMKFPDLVHSVKMEPDRGFPQAASAHDTFWDFASLMPETMHMLMWAMSDRGIPRTLRMIEGFGVNTFRFVNEAGDAKLVKFHWRPTQGCESTVWDEAVKIAGADPDFHRRDLWNAIEAGNFPEWELSVQVFDESLNEQLGFDVLDATKLIPEELVPLTPLGKMVLDRNPDNFFAETEQAAFHPGHVVPGIDFSEDPLLQGRLFSYLDTQLSRLGGPNFHEIPINRPRCPMRNFQRDGIARMDVNKGRVSYEPNSLQPEGPRENPSRGFVSHRSGDHGPKVRERSKSFSDHYSQARMFWSSMSEPEQRHIASAFAFELAKVETLAIRKRMLGHLDLIKPELGARVAELLGMQGQAETITPAVAPVDVAASPSLSLVKKHKPTLKGRKLGVLVADGADAKLLAALRKAVEAEGATVEVVAPKVGGAKASDGSTLEAQHSLPGAPSVVFDVLAVVVGQEGAKALLREAAAIDWLRDGFGHLKAIAHTADATPLLEKAAIEADDGIVDLGAAGGVAAFVEAAKNGRLWDREPLVRSA